MKERITMSKFLAPLMLMLITQLTFAGEYHVSPNGNDSNDGSMAKPYRTISAAAMVVQPGDVITVHEGIYRERVTPPRGGESDAKRITYQAAPGEMVVIKGSEVIRGWKLFKPGVWKVILPNSFFGKYNPYTDPIVGDWFDGRNRIHHTGEVYLNGKSLYEMSSLEEVLNPKPITRAFDPEGSIYAWYCESDEQNVSLYANFHKHDPNRELVEINVRDACFYPDQPGRNYITVRGFRMCHAATQWAAPTAEQIGLIGTHWSKGWIIENNVISDSKCSGITLGKDRKSGHNVWLNEPSKDGATHYNEVIVRCLQAGWSKENIGSHIVRNNIIFNCEQAGICGSMGGAFSRITNNHIYNIWTKRLFKGAEIAGIKLHGSIDVLIKSNRVHNAGRGMWMDWMAQGTRISGNLCYNNSSDDIFFEVDHGPYLVDNNILLSRINLRDWSEGGAYAHNLIAGRILCRPGLGRVTPFHQAHSTALAGLKEIRSGDDRFLNNIFVGAGTKTPIQRDAQTASADSYGLWGYDKAEFPLQAAGNVYFNNAQPYMQDNDAIIKEGFDPRPTIEERDDEVFLTLTLDSDMKAVNRKLVTTAILGKARVPNLPYENPDGSPLKIDRDYAGKPRNDMNPSPGPFENPGAGRIIIKAWPSSIDSDPIIKTNIRGKM